MGTPTKLEIGEVLAKAMGEKNYVWEREGHIIYVVSHQRENGKNADILHLFRLENRNSRSNPPLPLRVSEIELEDAMNLDIQCFLCPYPFIDRMKNSVLYESNEILRQYLQKCIQTREHLDNLEKETKILRKIICQSGTIYLQERKKNADDEYKKPTVWRFDRFTNRTLTAVECFEEANPNHTARFKLVELKQYGT